MKQAAYESASTPFSFDIPAEWKIEDLTAVNFACHDEDGNEVIASEAAVMYSETTLDGDVDKYSDSFVLDSTADAPAVGDMLTLAGVAGQERVIVKGYDSGDYTVTTELILDNNHEDNDRVLGNVISYDADLSDTDVFLAGKVFVITWTPSGTGVPFKESFQITKFKANTSDIERDFQDVYPRAFSAFREPVDRMARMIAKAESMLNYEMRSSLMDMNRIVGEPIFGDLLMAKMACLWTNGNADEDLDDERKVLKDEYLSLFTLMKQLPIWTDSNQDGIKNEDTEVSSHNHLFQRSW